MPAITRNKQCPKNSYLTFRSGDHSNKECQPGGCEAGADYHGNKPKGRCPPTHTKEEFAHQQEKQALSYGKHKAG